MQALRPGGKEAAVAAYGEGLAGTIDAWTATGLGSGQSEKVPSLTPALPPLTLQFSHHFVSSSKNIYREYGLRQL